jgi:hypothetical protein
MARRQFMRVEFGAPVPNDRPDVRTFEPDDVPALGGLMYSAYLDTVDYEGETPEQAAAEVHKTIRGEYGVFVPTCSKVAVRADSLL